MDCADTYAVEILRDREDRIEFVESLAESEPARKILDDAMTHLERGNTE